MKDFINIVMMFCSCFIWAVPLIVYRGSRGQDEVKDAIFRSLAAIFVGIAGYWLPLLGAYYIERPFPGVDFDDRLGFYFGWTLPIILVYAILATISLTRAHLQESFPSWFVGLLSLFGVGGLCWSPFISIGVNIVLMNLGSR